MKQDKRNIDIMQKALAGESYAELGRLYGLTRARVQQIVSNTYQKEYPLEFVQAMNRTRKAGNLKALCPRIQDLREEIAPRTDR